MADLRRAGRLAHGTRAAVSSGHALATNEALRVLQAGGNVVDAAVAGGIVLSVVLPYACGIGGDAYLLYHDARTATVHGINGTGAAPTLATREEFPGAMADQGVRSATVPGSVRAWEDALRQFGTRTLRELVKPAVALARHGFPAHEGIVENGHEKQALLSRDAEAARLFLPGGKPHALGASVVQFDLARSLEIIAEHGADAFYVGELAERFVAGTRALGGLFSGDELAAHTTLFQAPIASSFSAYDVFTMPPNSVGLALLLQLVALDACDLRRLGASAEALFLETEKAWRWAEQRARVARGDPRDAEPAARLVLAAAIREASASNADPVTERGAPSDAGDTSNLVVIDAAGNAVSLVQSVSAPYASGVVLPGTGILLNNRMRGFDTTPGSGNCVAPGRRPAHTLVPVLVRRDGRVVMSIGTPGAVSQPVTLAQVLVRILGCGEDVAAAIAAPRWSLSPSGGLMLERTACAGSVAAMRARDPKLQLAPERHVRFGSVKCVWSDEGVLHAAADHRRVAAAGAW